MFYQESLPEKITYEQSCEGWVGGNQKNGVVVRGGEWGEEGRGEERRERKGRGGGGRKGGERHVQRPGVH